MCSSDLWTAAELREVLGADAEFAAWHFGVEEGGNVPAQLDPQDELRGRNVLVQRHALAETARRFGLDPEAANDRLLAVLERLRLARDRRPRPHLDDKVLTSCNALMISALARAHRVLGDVEFLEAATRAADFIARELHDETGQALTSLLRPDAVVLSLQNGVDNVPTLQALLPNPVFPAVVYVATAMEGPGQLKHNGRGELVIGAMAAAGTPAPSPEQTQHHQALLQGIATVFAAAGVPCEVSARVKDELWFKFLINCVVNAVSAIGQIEYGRMVQVPEVRRLLSQLTTEFLAVAQAEAVHFDRADVDEKFEGLYVSMAGQRSSTAQDIGRGKRTEIEHLNGLLTRLGQQHGIPTPTHQAMLALVKLLEHTQHSNA